MNASCLVHRHVHQDRSDKVELTNCQTFVSSRPNERIISAANSPAGSVISIVYGLFSVQCITVNWANKAFHYATSKFVAKVWVKIAVCLKPQQSAVLPPKCPILFKKFSGGNIPNPCCWGGAIPFHTHPQHGLWPCAGAQVPPTSLQFDHHFHFQIPSAVYD